MLYGSEYWSMKRRADRTRFTEIMMPKWISGKTIGQEMKILEII